MATKKVEVGGSFAPPLDDAKLTAIEAMLPTVQPLSVRTAMQTLAKMLRLFWETPRSTNGGRPHPAGRGVIVSLEDEEVLRIWNLVPWPNEAEKLAHGKFDDDHCDQYGALFETLTDKATRDAAFHLLWYARELAQDREPITNDLL